MDLEDIVTRLEARLKTQNETIAKYRKYYAGDFQLSFSTQGYRDEFSQMLTEVCDNWMPIVVEAVSERMNVEGFRFGSEPEAGAEGDSPVGVTGKGDTEAWDIWQRNSLDADSELLHTSTLIDGIGYAMVWGTPEKDDFSLPIITIEDASQVYVLLESGSRRARRLAIKVWRDEWTDGEFVNLYAPDKLYKFFRKGDKLELKKTVKNPLGVVNVIPFYNRPLAMPGSYRSELQDVLSTQDQINKILCDAIVASEFAAYRQRWAAGIEVEVDPDTGQPKNPFTSNINRVFIAPDADAKFGSFEPTDLSNYTRFLENRIQSVASRTRTPPHYLLGQSGTFPSGETLKATETGLIAKVKSRGRHFGEAWEEVMRLAFKINDDVKAEYYRAETIWSDPESRTESEHVDALTKLKTLGVPIRQLWEDAGYSQEQIERMTQWAMEEALTASMAAPSPIVVTSGAPDDADNTTDDAGSSGGTEQPDSSGNAEQ